MEFDKHHIAVTGKKIIWIGVVLVVFTGIYTAYLHIDYELGPPDSESFSTEPTETFSESDVESAVENKTTASTKQTDLIAKSVVIESSSPSPNFDQAILWGTLQTETGEIISGEELQLYSASLNKQHTTTSQHNGEFSIDDISPAKDYRISVSPRGMYQRYNADIEIDSSQTYTDVVLQSLPAGLLVGRIVDVRGNPVPQFEISVRSLSKTGWSKKVASNEIGQFEVDQVPQGELEIFTGFTKQLKITGLFFAVESASEFILVVDVGPYSIMGNVYDNHGEPVAGASVLLSWVYRSGVIRSISNRRTMADSRGEFVIDGLGVGPHDLIVTASDIGVYRRNINVGNETGQVEAVLIQR